MIEPREPDHFCEHEVPGDFCADDVHNWFERYSSYLVLPRSLMQAMPGPWQHGFVRLLEELQATFQQENDHYAVNLRSEDGTFISDPFRGYRRPDRAAIEAARERARS